MKVAQSCPTLAAPWTVACQAPLFMEFSRSEYWSGSPFPSPGDLPHPEMEPRSPALQADSLPAELTGIPEFYNKDFIKIWPNKYTLICKIKAKQIHC